MLSTLRSSARPKLVDAGSFATPSRAELALAIAERRTAENALKSLTEASERLRRGATTTSEKVEAAKDALERAKEAASAHVLASAIGTAGVPPVTVKAARAALQEAEDEHAAAITARNGLDEHVTDAERNRLKADNRVRDAAKAVMRDHAAGLLDEVLRLQREMIAKGRALSWLMREEVLPGDSPKPRQEDDPLRAAWRTKQFIDMLPADYLVDAETGRYEANHRLYSGAPAWQEALEALTRDANATLPDIR